MRNLVVMHSHKLSVYYSCPAAGLHGQISVDDTLLLACACKASAHQPLLLPAHAALAAAMECSRQYTSAIPALQYCLALLRTAAQQGIEGPLVPGPAAGDSQIYGASYKVLLLQNSGTDSTSDDTVGVVTLTAALQLALARNLCLAGRHDEALGLYKTLESQGVLGPGRSSTNTYSWLCYGYAAAQSGQKDLCGRLLETAVNAAGGDLDKLHAVTALLQVGTKSSNRSKEASLPAGLGGWSCLAYCQSSGGAINLHY